MEHFTLEGNIVDIHKRRIFPGRLIVENTKIKAIEEISKSLKNFIVPGFIDAHIHIESSLLTPTEFARLAVTHGTIATVSDPHEIANVLGMAGIEFMITNAKHTPFKFFFGAPSCVPATSFETSGAEISVNDIASLLARSEILYLSEMMNFPGVIANIPEVLQKIEIAKHFGKPVDGHAPGLSGTALFHYIKSGITTDHECITLQEAREKILNGMKVLIREGSAAKNFDDLIPILFESPNSVMFCSDDKHPDDLVKGHMNLLLKRAVEKGVDPIDALRSVSVIPATHYKLPIGLLRINDPADFVVIDDLRNFHVSQTYLDGKLVAENGISLLPSFNTEPLNHFVAKPIKSSDLNIAFEDTKGTHIKVIETFDGQLVTKKILAPLHLLNNNLESNPAQDILKLVVINRYQKAKPAIAFVRGFGLKHGALASSVAHDSHNVIAVGTTDEELTDSINAVITRKGGIVITCGGHQEILPLPIAGLMTSNDGYDIAKHYASMVEWVKKLGTPLTDPFMTLSFLALLVIPEVKLSDKGLFDGTKFTFTSWVE